MQRDSGNRVEIVVLLLALCGWFGGCELLNNYKALIQNQYEAAFRTLKHCIDKCSDESWNKPVCNHQFCQAVFHGLFFADLYLGLNPESISDQAFHSEHAAVFEGYEEMERRPPEKTYEREFINLYLQHCRDKARLQVAEFTEEDLKAKSGFYWIEGSAAEVHVYNIRHIQHHAAQLSLRLRLDSEIAVPWVRSGWEE